MYEPLKTAADSRENSLLGYLGENLSNPVDKRAKSGYSIHRIEYYGSDEDEYVRECPKRACGWWKQVAEPVGRSPRSL